MEKKIGLSLKFFREILMNKYSKNMAYNTNSGKSISLNAPKAEENNRLLQLCQNSRQNSIFKPPFFYFSFFLFVFLSSFYSVQVNAQDSISSITIISDDNYPPYIFRDEKGNLQGIIVDEWKLWQTKTGIKANLIAKDWGKAYQYMLDGKADVLETVFYNDERAKIFDFTKPYAYLEVPVFFHKTLSGITDVKNLRGFTIGVKSGDACINIFRQNGITTLREFSSYEAIINAASNGEVRVFCIDKPPAIYYLYKCNLENDFKYSFTLYNGAFHRAVKKGRTELLETVETGFARISREEQEAIEKKWLGTSIPQPAYLSYAIYSLLIIAGIALFLVFINFLLRRKVKEKTRQLEIAFTDLSKSKDKYRSIFETANEGICVTNKSGMITAVNSKFEEMTGYKSSEILNKNFSTFVTNNQRQEYIEGNRDDKLGQRGNYEMRILKKDNSSLWTFVSRSPILDQTGKFDGLVEMFTDITERKMAEEEIRKLYQGVEQSPATIVITDINGDIEYINSKFVETTGYTYADVVGKNPRVLSSGEKSPEEYKELWEAIKAGKDWQGEFHNKKKNGELYWESASISPIKDENGEITHFIAIKEDITEKKMMIEDLIAAKEKAEEMNRLKSSFLANMSHELRTPLVGILGFTDILMTQIEDPELLKMVHGIYRGGKRLSDTLGLILDLSNAESNRIEINAKEINVTAATSEIVNSFSTVASKKGLQLQTTRNNDSIIAKLDERLFSNIVDNLINNAIKYTNKGGITVEVGKEKIDDKYWVYVKVIDTGIGIAKENFDIIFNEFRQASEGFGRNFEGAGLGLTISKKVAAVMGGVISVDSQLGIGSTFTVKFPAIEDNAQEPKVKDIEPAKPILTIAKGPEESEKPLLLYVEDDKTSQEIVKIYLKNYFNIEIADNGNSALEMVKAKTYDAFLMDINLGRGMNGIAVTKEIRKMPEYLDIPIIAITAFAMKGDKEEFIESGCTSYISKPFSQADLVSLLKDTIKRKSN